jgi:hypothetical protein
VLRDLFRAHTARPRGTYSEWWWPEPPEPHGNLRSYSVLEHVLVPEVDPGPGSLYFWAHQFRTVGGEGGYIGLQTKGNRADGSLGKMAIFSFWDTLGAEGPGVVRFGGEGVGWSCRIPYFWEAGRAYRLRVELVDVDGREAWWAASVADVDRGEDSQEFGRICAPAGWGGLGTWSVMWTEYYGPPLARCSDLAYSRVVFSTPSAENGSVAPNRWRDHLSDGPCDTSRITRLEGGVRQEMGLPEPGRE